MEERERHYGFMHNVEMWVRVCGGVAQVGFKLGYDIPKNVGMTMQGLKRKRGVSVFKTSWRPWRTWREKGIRAIDAGDCSLPAFAAPRRVGARRCRSYLGPGRGGDEALG